jgi:hypothetical protein
LHLQSAVTKQLKAPLFPNLEKEQKEWCDAIKENSTENKMKLLTSVHSIDWSNLGVKAKELYQKLDLAVSALDKHTKDLFFPDDMSEKELISVISSIRTTIEKSLIVQRNQDNKMINTILRVIEVQDGCTDNKSEYQLPNWDMMILNARKEAQTIQLDLDRKDHAVAWIEIMRQHKDDLEIRLEILRDFQNADF